MKRLLENSGTWRTRTARNRLLIETGQPDQDSTRKCHCNPPEPAMHRHFSESAWLLKIRPSPKTGQKHTRTPHPMLTEKMTGIIRKSFIFSTTIFQDSGHLLKKPDIFSFEITAF